jgi:outer membrane protein OmpA-like peptidoglycan-associated protein
MKKILSTSCFIISSVFLTGCWKPKKTIQAPIEEASCTSEVNSEKLNEIKEGNEGEMVVEFINEDTTAADESDNPVITIFDETETEEPQESTELSNEIEKTIPTSGNESDELIQKKQVHLGTLLFDFDVFKDVKKQYKKQLPEIAEKIKVALTQNKNVHVIIEGHACNSFGSEKYNLWLSNQRAEAMKQKLSEMLSDYADTLSLATFGCGTSHLIVVGNQEEQAPNRRVEVYIIANN